MPDMPAYPMIKIGEGTGGGIMKNPMPGVLVLAELRGG